MSEDNKNLGAPSSDETSALFVSARKKQLAQQEEERKRKEEEDKRLAAEAEVRRLEEEVRQRKLQAEEEARRLEEEPVQVNKEQGAPKVGDAVGNVFGGVARAAKDAAAKTKETVAKASASAGAKSSAGSATGGAKGGESALKLNPKMLAIIGGGVVVLIVAIVLIVTLSGKGESKGGGGEEIFATTFESYTELSAADQEAYVNDVIAYLEAEGFVPVPDSEKEIEASIAAIHKGIRDLGLAMEDVGYPVYSASGAPLWTFGEYFEDFDASLNNILRLNVAYPEWTADDIEQLTLIDFCRLEGDEFVSALLAAEDYLVEEGIVEAGGNVIDLGFSLFEAATYVVDMGGKDTTAKFGLLAAYGYMNGTDAAAVQALTGFDMGAFVPVPSPSDELDAEFIITAFGYSIQYPSSTLRVSDSSREAVEFSAISTAEMGQLLFAFGDYSWDDDSLIESIFSEIQESWIRYKIGENTDLTIVNSVFNEYENGARELDTNAYVHTTDGIKIDIFARTALLEGKPYTLVVLAPTTRLNDYLNIAQNIRDSMAMV